MKQKRETRSSPKEDLRVVQMTNLYFDFKWAITVGIFCLVVLIAVGVLLCIVALFRRSLPAPDLPRPI
uniref:Uncharacterized protein n=2 Tax=unclassified Ampelovirus TaxID=362246 RepID=A0A8F8SYY0_9CLOS|nr:hypothetical protein [Cassava ampelovirus 1]